MTNQRAEHLAALAGLDTVIERLATRLDLTPRQLDLLLELREVFSRTPSATWDDLLEAFDA